MRVFNHHLINLIDFKLAEIIMIVVSFVMILFSRAISFILKILHIYYYFYKLGQQIYINKIVITHYNNPLLRWRYLFNLSQIFLENEFHV